VERGEALDERVRHSGGERLEEVESSAVRDLADAGGHVSVVDRRLDAIFLRLAHLEHHVEEEGLPLLPLLVEDPVAAEDLEPVELNDHGILPPPSVRPKSRPIVNRASNRRRQFYLKTKLRFPWSAGSNRLNS
jgi:hypothetical protein